MTRAVMLVSILLASVGVLVSTVGMKCTRFLDGSDKTKNAVAMAGGIMFMLAGIVGPLSVNCSRHHEKSPYNFHCQARIK